MFMNSLVLELEYTVNSPPQLYLDKILEESLWESDGRGRARAGARSFLWPVSVCTVVQHLTSYAYPFVGEILLSVNCRV